MRARRIYCKTAGSFFLSGSGSSSELEKTLNISRLTTAKSITKMTSKAAEKHYKSTIESQNKYHLDFNAKKASRVGEHNF